MPVGFPTKVNYATGDVLSAANMNDLSGTVNLLESAQFAAGKNQLINGAFNNWQRGTSFTANGYTADRMYLAIGAGSGTLTRSTATPLPTGGSQYFARFTAGAASSNGALLQALETAAVIPLRGKTVTASGYFRGTFTGNVRIAATYSNSTDTLTSQTTSIGSNPVAVTTSWQRLSYTFTVPTDAVGLRLDFGSQSTPINNTQTLDIWGCQLEVASTASEFATATGTIQGELAACQRYYMRTTAGAAGQHFGNGNNQSTTVGVFINEYPVEMRIAPTALEQSGTAGDYSIRHQATSTACSAVPAFETASTKKGVFTLTVASGLTAGNGSFARPVNTSAYLGWSAEL